MEKKTVRLQLVIGQSELELLDSWRREQQDLPNRSEAIRRLISDAATAIGIKSEDIDKR